MSDLDQRLLAAHAADDRQALVTLYAQAAKTASDDDARGFFLTHAYIFALETNHPMTSELHGELKAMGRED